MESVPTREPEDNDLHPGVVVGPYTIVELLAHGGMGSVYRATDTRLQRDIALKVLNHTVPQMPGARGSSRKPV